MIKNNYNKNKFNRKIPVIVFLNKSLITYKSVHVVQLFGLGYNSIINKMFKGELNVKQ